MSLISPDIRAVCPGGSNFPYIGDCYQYGQTGSYTCYVNVTEKSPGGGEPVNGNGTSYVPMPCTNSITAPNYPGEWNCFEPSTAVSTSFCNDQATRGWKAIQSRILWQGSDKYSVCAGVCNTSSIRYLRNTRTIQGSIHSSTVANPGTANVTYSVDWQRQYTVNTASGYVSQDICLDSWVSSSDAAAEAFYLPTDMIQLSIACGIFDNTKYFSGDGSGSFNLPTGSTDYPPGSGGNPNYAFGGAIAGWILTSRNITDTSATYTIQSFTQIPATQSSDQVGSLTFTSTLSMPYTLGDVRNEGKTLLNYWDLSNDEEHPWRTDGDCTEVPVVKRDEVFATPEGQITDWGDCATFITGSTDGHIIGAPLPAGYGVPSGSHHQGFFAWEQDYWSPSLQHFLGVWTPANLPLNSTWWNHQGEAGMPPFFLADALYPEGAYSFFDPVTSYFYLQKYVVVQDQVPSFNYFRPCGEDRFALEQSSKICVSSVSGDDIILSTAPGFIVNDLVGLCSVDTFTDGIYQVTNIASTTINVLNLSQSYSFPNCDAGGVVAKMRFTGSRAPAICGLIHASSSLSASRVLVTLDEAATYLRTNDKVDFQNLSGLVYSTDMARTVTVIDTTHFSMALPPPSHSYVRSSGAPDYKWNDEQTKGDFIWLEWNTNTCTTTSSFTCSQDCNISTPCSPRVMAVLPPGSIEKFGDSKVKFIPVLTAANMKYQSIPIGSITDTYFQIPLDCNGTNLCAADPGLPQCTASYYEARCAVPDGAPELYTGFYLGCWNQPSPCGAPINGDCTTYSSDPEVGI